MTAKTHSALAGLALVLLGSSSALAADAQAFASRLKAVLEKQDARFAFASAASEGDNVVLKGVSLGTGDMTSSPIDVTFQNVTGSDAAGWMVEAVPIPDMEKTKDDDHLSVKGIAVKNLQIAGTAAPSTLPGAADLFFESASLGSLVFQSKGAEIMSLTGASVSNTATDDGGIETEGDLGSFKADFSKGDAPPEFVSTMTQLGLLQMAGTSSFSGTWDPKSGEVSLDPFTLSVENAGSLDFAYQVNGYTPAFIEQLGQVRKQMMANPDGQQSMALFGVISQLSVASMQLGFTDDSLTTKLLDFYAKQNGQTRDQLIDGIVAMMPAVLAALQNPDFQKQVTDAVQTFLKNPKSLTISADPKAPVSAMQIAGAAMGAPQTLPQVLDLTVTANGEGDTAQ